MGRAVWCAAAFLLAGCLSPSLPPIVHQADSSSWRAPGLYGDVAAREGSPPSGFEVRRDAPRGSLFPEARYPELDGAVPVSVSDGAWHIERLSDDAEPGLILLDDDFNAKAAQVRNSDLATLKASLVSFARRVVVAEDAALERLADEFVSAIPRVEWEHGASPQVRITQPLTFSDVAAALDAAGASPWRVSNSSMGSFVRAGGGFEVHYQSPVLTVQESGNPHLALHVAPDDLVRMHYREPSKGPQSLPLNETQLQQALARFMAAYGHPAPTNVTFQYFHGD